MSEWIEWHGEHAPTVFEPGQIVETRHRSSMEYTRDEAWPWDKWADATDERVTGFWVHDGTFSDIIAYRVVTP